MLHFQNRSPIEWQISGPLKTTPIIWSSEILNHCVRCLVLKQGIPIPVADSVAAMKLPKKWGLILQLQSDSIVYQSCSFPIISRSD